MIHNTYDPWDDLKAFVQCYWVLESTKEATPSKNTIIPDGTIKMIFHYWDLYKHHMENGSIIELPRCFVVWQLTKPYIVEPSGDTGIFIVRFHPDGFSPFSQEILQNIENTSISLEKFFWKKWKQLSWKVIKASETYERIKLVEDFLKGLLDKKMIDKIINSTIDDIISAKWRISVNQISKTQYISRRSLERKFSKTIGLQPKQLSKIVRLQSTLRALVGDSDISLARAAGRNNYYDQAHFNKDFKEFTWLSPKEFYGENFKMSLIFEERE